MNLYFLLPTFEPLATMPPGKGVMTPGTPLMASTAACAAIRAAIWFSPMMKKLPPATPLTAPNSSSPIYSPSMIGMAHTVLPPTSRFSSYPSPKKWSLTGSFSWTSATTSASPSKTAVVGAVRTHSERRSITCVFSFFLLAQIMIAYPGRPSGVSSGETKQSMPASAGHPMVEVANPTASTAALYAHSSVTAVIMGRATQVGNASA